MSQRTEIRVMAIVMWAFAIGYVLLLVYIFMGGCRERIQHIHKPWATYARMLGANASNSKASFASLQASLSQRRVVP